MGDTSSTLRGLVFLSCLLLAACHQPPQHRQDNRITDPKKLADLRKAFVPEAYLRPEDQKKAARLREGYGGPLPCTYEKVELGSRVIAGLPVDQCFKMTNPQRMRGLWRNDFEGSAFCATALDGCRPDNVADVVWLSFESALAGAKDTPPGGRYAIDFIGRKTAYPGVYDGGAPQEIIVDRLISIKLVEPPSPGQMTKEHIEGYLKDCAGKQICMPNSEVPGRK